MKRITSADFRKAVVLDPAWAAKLDEPVEIIDFCDMRSSGITHLSPLLNFTGKDKEGNVADFSCCNIKVAEGQFHGAVYFTESQVEEINPDGFCVHGPNNLGTAAVFEHCDRLQTAQGTFHGTARFQLSGIRKIDPEKLVIHPINIKKIYVATFGGCPNLHTAEGTFPGPVDFAGSKIRQIGEIKITRSARDDEYIQVHGEHFNLFPHVRLENCKKLSNVPDEILDNPDYSFGGAKTRLKQENRARKVLKETRDKGPTLEI